MISLGEPRVDVDADRVKSCNYYSLDTPEPTSSVKTKEKRQYECSSEWVRDILTPQVKYTDEEL